VSTVCGGGGGDWEGKDESLNAHDPQIARLVHYQDPVPHLPPNDLLGKPFFQHPTTEVFYQERDSTGSYKICEGQEDPTCSDKFLVDINLLNHLHYVGFDFISNYLACKL
jgi:hypothetical protein